MASESIHVVNIISATCAAIFLSLIPLRLWKLRSASIRSNANWEGFSKAVGFPVLSPLSILSLN